MEQAWLGGGVVTPGLHYEVEEQEEEWEIYDSRKEKEKDKI